MTSRKRVAGGSKLRRQLRRFDPALREELAKEMTAIGRELAEEVRLRAPKDEMDLANAVHFVASRDGMGVAVGYSKDKTGFKRMWKKGGFVALFQEFGTSQHAAQPFLRPAWRANIKSALDRIDNARRAAVKNVLRST